MLQAGSEFDFQRDANVDLPSCTRPVNDADTPGEPSSHTGCRRNYGLPSKVRPGGVIVRAVDLRFRRSRVRLRALRFQVTTLGKLFTHIWSFMPLTVILVLLVFDHPLSFSFQT